MIPYIHFSHWQLSSVLYESSCLFDSFSYLFVINFNSPLTFICMCFPRIIMWWLIPFYCLCILHHWRHVHGNLYVLNIFQPDVSLHLVVILLHAIQCGICCTQTTRWTNTILTTFDTGYMITFFMCVSGGGGGLRLRGVFNLHMWCILWYWTKLYANVKKITKSLLQLFELEGC